MADTVDVVLSYFSSVPKEVQALFTRPTRFVALPVPDGQHYLIQLQENPKSQADWRLGGWPHPLRAIFNRYGISNPGRVAVMGFSQGVQGVNAILRSEDAGYIEHVLMFDGLHCSWTGGKPNEGRSNIEQTCLASAKAAAQLAAKGPTAIAGMPPGQHHFTLTHSSIIPPGFPATSDTAREIIASLWMDPPEVELPSGMSGQTFDPPWVANNVVYAQDTMTYAVGENGCTILGYKNIDPMGTADHIYQSKIVLPAVLSKLLVPRWNGVNPSDPICGVGSASGQTGGDACSPNGTVAIPYDYFSDPQDASLQWQKFVDTLQQEPKINVGGIIASTVIGASIGVVINRFAHAVLDMAKRS